MDREIKSLTDGELMQRLAGLSGEAMKRGLIKTYPPMRGKGIRIAKEYLTK